MATIWTSPPVLYVHQEQRAVEHAFSVASGLDSMVLGEAQILGQLKDAYRVAQEAGSTGPCAQQAVPSGLLRGQARAIGDANRRERRVPRLRHRESGAPRVFGLERPYRPHGRRRRNERAHCPALHERRRQAHGHRQSHPGAGPRRLAAELKADAVGLEDLDKELAEADIVITCTASPVPLITKSAAEAAIRARRRRPIFMVDLAVPRDIDPAVADLEDVYLFSIDDLQQLIDENRQQREVAAGDARLLIDEEVARFLTESRAQDAGPAIRALRQQADGDSPANRGTGAAPAGRRQIRRRSHRVSGQHPHQSAAALTDPGPAPGGGTGRFGPGARRVTRLLIEERDRQ